MENLPATLEVAEQQLERQRKEFVALGLEERFLARRAVGRERAQMIALGQVQGQKKLVQSRIEFLLEVIEEEKKKAATV